MNIVPLRKFPFVLAADEAFALKPFLLQPFPRRNDINLHKRIFNHRLSRVRQVIGNTFGILASRFQIFGRFIIGKTGNIKKVIKAAVILHNFHMSKSTKNMYCPPDYVDQEASQGLFPGSWRNETTNIQGLIDLKAQGFNNSTRAAKEVRNDSKDYFNLNKVNLVGKGKLSRALQVC